MEDFLPFSSQTWPSLENHNKYLTDLKNFFLSRLVWRKHQVFPVIAFVYPNLINQSISMKMNHSVSLSGLFSSSKSIFWFMKSTPAPAWTSCSWQVFAQSLESGNITSPCCCSYCIRPNLKYSLLTTHFSLRQNLIVMLSSFSLFLF